MALTQLILQNFFSFVFLISLIVFIHELGHFLLARFCGVKIEEFSIGFGREIFAFVDKKNTRWKFCLLPFGGYVKMFGDRNGASMPDSELLAKMSPEERGWSFLGKNVYQRSAIVAAGPVFNFVLTILIFTALFKINGFNTVLPVIDEVLLESAASEVGLKKGDEILSINDSKIVDFEQVREVVLASSGDLIIKIKRGDEIFEKIIAPKDQVRQNFFGEEVKMKTIGITASAVNHSDLGLWQSFVLANKETVKMSAAIFNALAELVTGKRSVKELGGPIKIAKYSGKTVEMGVTATLWFLAMISLNLGVMNLLPVPVLDGGHLFFYFIEALRGKPLSAKAQQIGFQIGLTLVLSLMIFTTVNDLVQLLR